jgi:hypothetical protein
VQLEDVESEQVLQEESHFWHFFVFESGYKFESVQFSKHLDD